MHVVKSEKLRLTSFITCNEHGTRIMHGPCSRRREVSRKLRAHLGCSVIKKCMVFTGEGSTLARKGSQVRDQHLQERAHRKGQHARKSSQEGSTCRKSQQGSTLERKSSLTVFNMCIEHGARSIHLARTAVSQAEGTSCLHSDQEVHGIARPGLAGEEIVTAPCRIGAPQSVAPRRQIRTA